MDEHKRDLSCLGLGSTSKYYSNRPQPPSLTSLTVVNHAIRSRQPLTYRSPPARPNRPQREIEFVGDIMPLKHGTYWGILSLVGVRGCLGMFRPESTVLLAGRHSAKSLVMARPTSSVPVRYTSRIAHKAPLACYLKQVGSRGWGREGKRAKRPIHPDNRPKPASGALRALVVPFRPFSCHGPPCHSRRRGTLRHVTAVGSQTYFLLLDQ